MYTKVLNTYVHIWIYTIDLFKPEVLTYVHTYIYTIHIHRYLLMYVEFIITEQYVAPNIKNAVIKFPTTDSNI